MWDVHQGKLQVAGWSWSKEKVMCTTGRTGRAGLPKTVMAQVDPSYSSRTPRCLRWNFRIWYWDLVLLWSSPSCCGCDIGFPSVQTCKPNKPLLIQNYPVCAVLLFCQKMSEDSGIWLLGCYREQHRPVSMFGGRF